MDLEATIRRFTRQALGGARALLRLTNLESLAVTQVEDKYAELSRSGRRFYGGNSIIANGIAPVAAIPTTTATLALCNPNSTKSLIINRVGMWLGSGTAAAGATLFGSVARPVDAQFPAGPNATGYTTGSTLGPSGPSPSAFIVAAVTVPAATVWAQILSTFQLAAANVGQGDTMGMVDDGMWIVPPRCVLGLGILSGAGTTPLYGLSFRWSELDLDLYS